MRIARTGLIAAAALIALSGCASAEDLASGEQSGDSTSETTDEPTDEPTDDDTTETQEPSTPTPSAGDCHKVQASQISSGIAQGAVDSTVKCGKRHNAQTFYVTNATGATKKSLTSGDLTTVYEKTESTCRKELPSWIGGNEARLARTGYDVIVGAPPASDVQQGATWVRCDVVLYDPSNGRPVDLSENTRGSLRQQTSDVDFCIKGRPKATGTNVVLCARPHDMRSVGVVKFGEPSDSYPGRSQVERRMRQPCLRQARKYLGRSAYTGWTFPTAETWNNGDRYGECYAKTKK